MLRKVLGEHMKRQRLAAVACLVLVFILPADGLGRPISVAMPSIIPQQGCRLCMNPPADQPQNELELLFINSGEYINLELVTTPPVITLYPSLGDQAKGYTIRDGLVGWKPGYFEGTILPGPDHGPDYKVLHMQYCAACRAALLEASAQGDLVLLDLAGRRLYSLGQAPAHFTIRRYTIHTSRQWGDGIGLMVYDPLAWQQAV